MTYINQEEVECLNELIQLLEEFVKEVDSNNLSDSDESLQND
ncbi:16155_t:CDS:2, partial [Racocetra persica]